MAERARPVLSNRSGSKGIRPKVGTGLGITTCVETKTEGARSESERLRCALADQPEFPAFDAVAAGALGGIERIVGACHDIVYGCALPVAECDSPADRTGKPFAIFG